MAPIGLFHVGEMLTVAIKGVYYYYSIDIYQYNMQFQSHSCWSQSFPLRSSQIWNHPFCCKTKSMLQDFASGMVVSTLAVMRTARRLYESKDYAQTWRKVTSHGLKASSWWSRSTINLSMTLMSQTACKTRLASNKEFKTSTQFLITMQTNNCKPVLCLWDSISKSHAGSCPMAAMQNFPPGPIAIPLMNPC